MPKRKPQPVPAEPPPPRYRLTLDARQAAILVEALDLYSRIGMGQLEIMEEHLRWGWQFKGQDGADRPFPHKEFDTARRLLDVIKGLLFDVPPGANHGIYSEKISDAYRVAWDIQKVVRHALYLARRGTEPQDSFAGGVDSYPPDCSVKDQPLAEIESVP